MFPFETDLILEQQSRSAQLLGKVTGRPTMTGNLNALGPSAGLWAPPPYLLPDTSPVASSIGHNLGDPGLTIQKPRHSEALQGSWQEGSTRLSPNPMAFFVGDVTSHHDALESLQRDFPIERGC